MTLSQSQSDSEKRARRVAAMQRVGASPAFREKMRVAARRSWARRVVIAAGLPLFKRFVDRAVDLLEAGESTAVAADALRNEFGKARP